MATVTDYASLAQAVNDWYTRNDLAAKIDYFIQQAENTLYNDILEQNQGRGVQAMETSFSGTTDANGNLALPTGYLAMKIALVQAFGSTFELVRKTPEYIFTNYPSRNPTAAPAYFARLGQNLIFGPCPDAAYTVSGTYWQRSAPLSASNTTTWMTQSCPSLLLAACCQAAAVMLRDQDQLQVWSAAYNSQLTSMLAADRAEELSGSSLAITPG